MMCSYQSLIQSVWTQASLLWKNILKGKSLLGEGAGYVIGYEPRSENWRILRKYRHQAVSLQLSGPVRF